MVRYVPFVLVLAFLAAPSPAQEKENPIEAAVKASLTDPTKPFTMLVLVKVKDGAGPKFEKAFAKARIETRKEKGNKAYEMSRVVKTPNEYVIYERWQNFSALQAHIKAAHTTSLLKEIGDFLASPPAVKVLLPVSE